MDGWEAPFSPQPKIAHSKGEGGQGGRPGRVQLQYVAHHPPHCALHVLHHGVARGRRVERVIDDHLFARQAVIPSACDPILSSSGLKQYRVNGKASW